MDGDRCTGVEYRTADETFSVRCDREVILSAGAIGTVVLLLSSGIGPAAELHDLGISVSFDLPGVGCDLFDHPMACVVYRSARPIRASSNNGAETQGLLRSRVAGSPALDLQLAFADVPLRAPHLDGPAPGHGYTIAVSPVAPRSRGTIRLARAPDGHEALIDPAYYRDGHDIDVAVAGIRLAREIGASRALAEWRAAEALPGADARTAGQLREYVRHSLRSYHHYGGTCRMGTDPRSVVGPDLLVHGISGLRVADASVMPAPPTANINATAYAIAERAAVLTRGGTDLKPT